MFRYSVVSDGGAFDVLSYVGQILKIKADPSIFSWFAHGLDPIILKETRLEGTPIFATVPCSLKDPESDVWYPSIDGQNLAYQLAALISEPLIV